MSLKVNIDGAVRQVVAVYCNVAGQWEKATSVKVNVNGAWQDGRLDKMLINRWAVTPLSNPKIYYGAASIPNYALFAGGCNTQNSNIYYSDSEAYNASLVKIALPELQNARKSVGSGQIGSYAVFVGGTVSGYSNGGVDAYNTSLTKVGVGSVSAGIYTGASTSSYAMFFSQSYAYAFNSSLGRSNVSAPTSARTGAATTQVGGYVLYAGGYTTSDYSATVDVYNSDLTRLTPTSLSIARHFSAGASTLNYGIIAGGNSGGYREDVDAFNIYLVRMSPLSLGYPYARLTGISGYGLAMFAGGHGWSENPRTNSFDDSLIRSSQQNLRQSRYLLGSAQVGGYILFGCGATENSKSLGETAMDAYMLDYN